jgi:hypothetical protein
MVKAAAAAAKKKERRRLRLASSRPADPTACIVPAVLICYT